MLDEVLAVVDEFDNVIGQGSRNQIHQLGLRHRAVHILIFNEQNQVFVQLRSMSKDINPGLWDSSAAGHVDFGEEYADCAIRETHEELGINLPGPPERLFKVNACRETGMEFIEVFRDKYSGPFRLNTAEIDRGKWVSFIEMDSWVNNDSGQITESFKLIWRIFRKKCSP